MSEINDAENERLRAIEYRRKMVARINNRAAAERSLVGDESARLQNLANWRPLVPDKNGGWEPESLIDGEPK